MGQRLFVAAGRLHDEVNGGVTGRTLHGRHQTLKPTGVVRVLAEEDGLLLVTGEGDIQRLPADVDPNDEGGHGTRSLFSLATHGRVVRVVPWRPGIRVRYPRFSTPPRTVDRSTLGLVGTLGHYTVYTVVIVAS